MRVLVGLFFLVALAVPFGDAGPAAPPAAEACGPGEAIHSLAGRGGEGLPETDLLAPFAVAASGTAQLPNGGNDGPRRTLTPLPRRAPSPPALTSSARQRREARTSPSRASLGPALRSFPAHPSTAPPRAA